MRLATIEEWAADQIRIQAALRDPLVRRDMRREQYRMLPTTFPNDKGNYRGKRTPKPRVAALSGPERFAKLVAAYEAFRCR